MGFYLKHLSAKEVYSRIDIEASFNQELTVVFGDNGIGKTTMLHIIANALEGSIESFVFLPFKRIVLSFANRSGKEKEMIIERRLKEQPLTFRIGDSEPIDFNIEESRNLISHAKRSSVSRRYIRLERESVESVTKKQERIRLILSGELGIEHLIYFPAFRSMIDAWSASSAQDVPEEYLFQYRKELGITDFARELFGDFVPIISYPSVLIMEKQLEQKISDAVTQIARHNQDLLSIAFSEVFEALSAVKSAESRNSEQLLEEIEKLVTKIDTFLIPEKGKKKTDLAFSDIRQSIPKIRNHEWTESIGPILEVYHNSLTKLIDFQEKMFNPINQFISSVNRFFVDKKLELSLDSESRHSIGVRYEQGDNERIGTLSSGERQILTMLYAACFMSQQKSIVLIDEPEISLHIDWQRRLIPEMENLLKQNQLIVCTHSPVIGSNASSDDNIRILERGY